MARSNLAAISAGIVMCMAQPVRAESFFQVELGLGAGAATDGDGIWVQKQGVPHEQKTVTPAMVAGISAGLYRHDGFDIRGRLDYTWFGQDSVSCMCVSDAAYAARDYAAPKNYFYGFGHTQGVSLMAEIGYSYRGWRFSAEAGPWINWSTWREYDNTPWGPDHPVHNTSPSLGYVAGVGVERGNLGIHYRYYSVKQSWNPYPGVVTGAHLLYMQYRF